MAGGAGRDAESGLGGRTAASGAPLSVGGYVRTFSPSLDWSELTDWPPDVFAFANLVLNQTEAYRFAVAPPPGDRWPPDPGWNEWVAAVAAEWRSSAAAGTPAPPGVREIWDRIVDQIDQPLEAVRSGRSVEVWSGLLSLHAAADEACANLLTVVPREGVPSFERRAWDLFRETGSLARVAPSRIRVLPKTNFAQRGITIRSLSRYLALSYEAIPLAWRRLETEVVERRARRGLHEYNAVVVPWPLEVRADAFRPIDGPLDNLDRDRFGFFEFDPGGHLDLDLVAQVLATARRAAGHIDVVIFPEGAMEPADITPLEAVLAEHGAVSLLAGVRTAASTDLLGSNYVHIGVRTSSGWERYRQYKHHRWCLDEGQIRQYHLCRNLAPGKLWWEGIELSSREVHIIELGGGMMLAPLVCEDLARLDEVADVLRCIGPSLVVALLLDGPQLATRWPFRYASVLADEPGSAVLTVTSIGMAVRSRPAGHARSRVVALWNDPSTGRHELTLERGAAAMLLTARVEPTTVWTADGRSHPGRTPALTLSHVTPLSRRSAVGMRRPADG